MSRSFMACPLQVGNMRFFVYASSKALVVAIGSWVLKMAEE